MGKKQGGDQKSGGAKGAKGKGDEKDSGSGGKKNGQKIKVRHILW